MSTTRTLDEQLNEKADQEFNSIVNNLVNKISPRELFNCYDAIAYKDVNGHHWSSYDVCKFVRATLEVYRPHFREKFKSEFIYKVGAMQKEMESYIGSLQPQEGHQ
jgi:hypothetical protein